MKDNIIIVIGLLAITVVSFAIGLNYGKSLRLKYNPPTIVKPDSPSPQIHFHYYQPAPVLGQPQKKSKLQVYSDAEQYCMAQNIYFEAGNQSPLGKLAVGLVVMTRVNDSRFPDTICGVIKQKSQFSWVNDGRSNEPKKDWVWDESVRISADVLESSPEFLQFVSRYLGGWTGLTNYHADYVSPGWSAEMEQVVTVDQHIFYRN